MNQESVDLYDTITKQSQWYHPLSTYARYRVILKSSEGSGGSRMVDELSKEHLVIPIHLERMVCLYLLNFGICYCM